MGLFILGGFSGIIVGFLLTSIVFSVKEKQSNQRFKDAQNALHKIKKDSHKKSHEFDLQIKSLETIIQEQNHTISQLQSKFSSDKEVNLQVRLLQNTIQKQNEEIIQLRSKLYGQIEIEHQKNLLPKKIAIEESQMIEELQVEIIKKDNDSFLSCYHAEKISPEYIKLQEYLSEKTWQSADQETSNLLFECRQTSRSHLLVQDYQCLDLAMLVEIDNLWRYYSNGLFGFSIQHKIYREICPQNQINIAQWREIGRLLNWRKNDQWISGSQDLIVSMEAPPGQFPFLSYWQGVWLNGFMDGQSDRFVALMSRFSDSYK